MLTEAVPIFILTVLVIFLMKDKPDIAPRYINALAQLRRADHKDTFQGLS